MPLNNKMEAVKAFKLICDVMRVLKLNEHILLRFFVMCGLSIKIFSVYFIINFFFSLDSTKRKRKRTREVSSPPSLVWYDAN